MIRAIAAVAIELAVVGVAGPAASGEMNFDVFLDDRRIGNHSYALRDAGDGRQLIESDASFDLKLLGVVVYRYRHSAREEWMEGCLQRLDASTDDNGERVTVRAAAKEGRVEVSLPEVSSTQATCASGYAYWNPGLLQQQAQLLNPQTGRFDPVTFEHVGEETLQREGVGIPARRYRLESPDLLVHLWYSPAGEWLQLESPARGNRRLRYQLRRGGDDIAR